MRNTVLDIACIRAKYYQNLAQGKRKSEVTGLFVIPAQGGASTISPVVSVPFDFSDTLADVLNTQEDQISSNA